MEYNEQQQAAITAPLGRMAIMAGPGTGKTATVVERIAYVVQHCNIQPHHVLAITFTRKAAAELKRRLRDRLHDQLHGRQYTAPAAMTIHSLAAQILRRAQPEFMVDPEQFDSLVPNALTLLHDNSALCAALQVEWQYIVVDEFQDVDLAQVELIELLGARHRNICIVGDLNQSIYSFRGAAPEALHQFCTAETQRVTLIMNYRSQANIVSASQALLRGPLQATRPATVQLEHTITSSVSREAHNVIEHITTLVGASDHLALETSSTIELDDGGIYTFSDIAVIYRLNTIGDQFERSVREAGLPYRRVGQATLFNQPIVAEYLAQLPDVYLDNSRTLAQQLPKQFATELFDDFRLVVESFDDLSAEAARQALLDHVVLAQPEDDYEAEHNTITLLTAHAAKGLEFPVVFIIGAEDGLFPYTEQPDCNADEERRLFYVAMTRAKDRLYISCAKRRTIYGQSTERFPSRFITNLPTTLLHTNTIKALRRLKQTTLF